MMEKLPVKFRAMEKTDLPDVMEIVEASFEFPCTEDYFLSDESGHVHVLEFGEDALVVGFFCYRVKSGKLTILYMAVHPAYRRRGVGAAIVHRMTTQRSGARSFSVLVHESSLDAQLFFKSQGFEAVAIDGDEYKFTLDARRRDCLEGQKVIERVLSGDVRAGSSATLI